MFGPRFVTSEGKKGTDYQPKDMNYSPPADAEELANEPKLMESQETTLTSEVDKRHKDEKLSTDLKHSLL